MVMHEGKGLAEKAIEEDFFSYSFFSDGRISLNCGDALQFYHAWPSPVVIHSDGPYGINGYPGDLLSPKELPDWYEPHIKRWSQAATPLTTLWFWNTERGWAEVHPVLEANGWDYVSCCIWDKGMSHVAGNVNTKTIRHFPVVSEVCVQYVKRPVFSFKGRELSMQQWLREEWQRTSLPLCLTNEACGVKNAATRKYFTKCHLWYMPPAEAFEKIALYANTYGAAAGRPYFSWDGENIISRQQWANLRAKFSCPHGVTNVWRIPQLRDGERLKQGAKALHLNQKPKSIINNLLLATTEEKDVVWDPFAGLCSVASSCIELNRSCYAAEIREDVCRVAKQRLIREIEEFSQRLF